MKKPLLQVSYIVAKFWQGGVVRWGESTSVNGFPHLCQIGSASAPGAVGTPDLAPIKGAQLAKDTAVFGCQCHGLSAHSVVVKIGRRVVIQEAANFTATMELPLSQNGAGVGLRLGVGSGQHVKCQTIDATFAQLLTAAQSATLGGGISRLALPATALDILLCVIALYHHSWLNARVGYIAASKNSYPSLRHLDLAFLSACNSCLAWSRASLKCTVDIARWTLRLCRRM